MMMNPTRILGLLLMSLSLLGNTLGVQSAAPSLPPPPPPNDECMPRPVIVFFARDSAEIVPEAASILDGAIAQYAGCGPVSISIAGFADRSGAPRYNIALSRRRAEAVKAYLGADPRNRAVMTIQAYGEDPAHLRVPTPDGVQEVRNRRVELDYGPVPGN
jgi:OOP family OmpA-OmpF porin